MLESTITNKEMIDAAKVYQSFTLSFVRPRENFPKQFMSVCLYLPAFALKSPAKMVIVE